MERIAWRKRDYERYTSKIQQTLVSLRQKEAAFFAGLVLMTVIAFAATNLFGPLIGSTNNWKDH